MKKKRQSKRLPLLLLAGLLAFFFTPAAGQAPKLLPSDLKPQVQQFVMMCFVGETAFGDMFTLLQTQWREQIEFRGRLPSGIDLFITTNEETNSWSLIGINGKQVCMIFAGGEWQQFIKPELEEEKGEAL